MAVSVVRWVFHDPKLNETWTVPKNPDAMTSPYPTRKYVYNSTTAGPAGVSVANEAHADPTQWQFSGLVTDQNHFDSLVKWSRKQNRFSIIDHFGRALIVSIDKIDMVPRRVNPMFGRYWTHTYSATCSVYAIIDADVPAPHLVSVTPWHGLPSGSITIGGTNLSNATAVMFGTHAASFTVNSDSSITAIVPTGADGDVLVTVTTPKGTSNGLDFLVGYIL